MIETKMSKNVTATNDIPGDKNNIHIKTTTDNTLYHKQNNFAVILLNEKTSRLNK